MGSQTSPMAMMMAHIKIKKRTRIRIVWNSKWFPSRRVSIPLFQRFGTFNYRTGAHNLGSGSGNWSFSMRGRRVRRMCRHAPIERAWTMGHCHCAHWVRVPICFYWFQSNQMHTSGTHTHQLDKRKQINLPIIKSNEDVFLSHYWNYYRFIV